MATNSKATGSHLFQIGQTVRIVYPSRNVWGVPIEYVDRKIRIISIEDVSDVPIPLEDIIQIPRLRRGATIVMGVESSTGNTVGFYREAMEGGTLPGFQLSLWRPDEPEVRQRPIGPVFAPTAKDWALLVDAVRDIHNSAEDFGDFRVAAFPVKGGAS